jgi:hypothetical protein
MLAPNKQGPSGFTPATNGPPTGAQLKKQIAHFGEMVYNLNLAPASDRRFIYIGICINGGVNWFIYAFNAITTVRPAGN